MSLYRLIEEESQRQPVSRLCRTLGVTRSGFYVLSFTPRSVGANWSIHKCGKDPPFGVG